ncbi:hypothetical protein SAMN05421830_10914 [Desulfomicrobium norvegicum]|uniref:Uncharacterized protein n=1 Tax=Desulfomicrobium norvegicum (strain DSM 1741 / NCIMB 8310) TaxID=52561 RepID=A0A8G2C425_DESNO|nr:hypothetical protein [Desulfomicrobium norvegicum]SFL91047.1 hypothetical protein SAMN05421830_10914 [Desulfomicrobium norvegicum]
MVEQLHELERGHNVMPDREGRVVEFKRDVNELLTLAGQPLRYQRAAGGDEV